MNKRYLIKRLNILLSLSLFSQMTNLIAETVLYEPFSHPKSITNGDYWDSFTSSGSSIQQELLDGGLAGDDGVVKMEASGTNGYVILRYSPPVALSTTDTDVEIKITLDSGSNKNEVLAEVKLHLDGYEAIWQLINLSGTIKHRYYNGSGSWITSSYTQNRDDTFVVTIDVTTSNQFKVSTPSKDITGGYVDMHANATVAHMLQIRRTSKSATSRKTQLHYVKITCPTRNADYAEGSDLLFADIFDEGLSTKPVQQNGQDLSVDQDLMSATDWNAELNEGNVFHAKISSNPSGTANDFQIGIGKGGQIYSLKNGINEYIDTEQRPYDAEWVDEIFQFATYNNNSNYGNANYGFYFQGWDLSPYTFQNTTDTPLVLMHENPNVYSKFKPTHKHTHQAGCYNRDPKNPSTFYSPLMADYVDEANDTFYSLNWAPSSHLRNIHQGEALYYTRMRSVEAGVIEVTYSIYNFSENMPLNQNNIWIVFSAGANVSSNNVYNEGTVPNSLINGHSILNKIKIGIPGTDVTDVPVLKNTDNDGSDERFIKNVGDTDGYVMWSEGTNSSDQSFLLTYPTEDDDSLGNRVQIAYDSGKTNWIINAIYYDEIAPLSGRSYRFYLLHDTQGNIENAVSTWTAKTTHDDMGMTEAESRALGMLRYDIDTRNVDQNVLVKDASSGSVYLYKAPFPQARPVFLNYNTDAAEYFISTSQYSNVNYDTFNSSTFPKAVNGSITQSFSPSDAPAMPVGVDNDKLWLPHDGKVEYIGLLGYAISTAGANAASGESFAELKNLSLDSTYEEHLSATGVLYSTAP